MDTPTGQKAFDVFNDYLDKIGRVYAPDFFAARLQAHTELGLDMGAGCVMENAFIVPDGFGGWYDADAPAPAHVVADFKMERGEGIY